MLFFSPQLFVGLSFPYEGPAPLEAIANGCAFLNPKFTPPKSSKNTDFFKGKPTLREVRRHSVQGHQSKRVCVRERDNLVLYSLLCCYLSFLLFMTGPP